MNSASASDKNDVLEMRRGEFVILQVASPGGGLLNAGVLLVDPQEDRAYVRVRRDWEAVTSQDSDFLEELEPYLRALASESGASWLLRYIENDWSNFIRVSDREPVAAASFESALEQLYRQHVAPKVLPFRTHLPRYSLRAAAGKFGEHMEVEPEGWEEIPPGISLTEDMFVGQVVGRSMEPRIPDGSYCIFRANVAGSREGKLLLVEHFGEPGENRYTVKRYRSKKIVTEEGFQHQRIIMEPLNPEFEPWEITEGSSIRVIAEFVSVLRRP